MSDDNLFSNLKDSLEQSKEVVVDASEHYRPIHRVLVISDHYDDYKERYRLADNLGKRLGAEVKRLFLYDIETFLQSKCSNEELDESDKVSIELLREHSHHIKELKERKVSIIFDDTVRELLFSLRDVRKVQNEDDLNVEEFEALTDFFLANHNREQNFANSVREYLSEFNPDLTYFKPPILRNRGGGFDSETSPVTHQILKSKPNGSWVFLRGKVSLRDVKDATILIIGGQDTSDIMHSAQSAVSVFTDYSSANFRYLTLIDKKKVNLASMVSDMDSMEEIKKVLKQKIESSLQDIRINKNQLKGDVVFGEVETHLPAFLSENGTDLVFVSPKVTSENQFDDEIMNSLFEIIRIGISVFVSY